MSPFNEYIQFHALQPMIYNAIQLHSYEYSQSSTLPCQAGTSLALKPILVQVPLTLTLLTSCLAERHFH